MPAKASGPQIMPAAVLTVAAHAAVLLAHEIAHRRLGVDLRLWQTAFAYVVIVAGPVAGVVLARKRPRAGFALLALAMAAALLFTLYHHYVGVSPDNVAHLPPGGARPLFRWTSALLALLEAAGAWVGWRGWKASRTLAS
ncbi:MAG TPA: hypothetical protein VML95_02630 [Longimicrobiales bacterium]|nr:hypothetical protein [Longimicrobiales bacterium]